MFKTLARTVAVVAVACLPFAAVAESKHEHDHDHEAMAKHGGTIAEVGSYDVEVMLTGGNLVLYVYDEHGKDITKKASKGEALFVVDGATKKVTLAPADGALPGPLRFDAAPAAALHAVLRHTVSGHTTTSTTHTPP